ncbi:NHL repeat-containing protein [Flavobacterium humi]|uniref:SMP-30/Gluconolactonase/LRE-like region domain-containing protein n=1 Tax=Flavobacterium humi TaxID=2562683 RepID=A0A4Z0LC29_9FLAO|nr:hypothetical protein [Flavobacterium humi]TGD59434.1 hypothetical protein E4635_00425 [Flavobacterium humi]
MKFNCIKNVFFCLVFSLSLAQSQKEMYNLSIRAYQDKDFGKFLKLTQKLDSIRPSHPTYTYNLACAYALNEKPNEALSVLKQCVLMNHALNFEAENDLSSLKKTDGYAEIVALKSALEIPVATSEKQVVLSEKELHPEGLLYLKNSKTWLVTSIRNRKIVSFDIHTGACQDWFASPDLLSVFAVKADKKEKFLWACTSAMPEMKGYNKGFEGKSEIIKIDIKTKKIVKRFPLQGNHVLGDLVVAKNGDVYISDSGEAIIFKISGDTISMWLDLKKEAFNLQGLTFNEGESQLFIADYMKGILSIRMSNPEGRNWLQFPESNTVKGIDGLLWYKNSLIAIHNGVKPIRIMRYSLRDNEIIASVALDHNRPEFDEPALGTLSNGKLYFFANAPWKAYNKDFDLDLTQFSNPVLYTNTLTE